MTNPQKKGHTFILHLWREKDNGRFIWRGSLTDVQHTEKKYFQSLLGLADLLARLLEDIPMDGLDDPEANFKEDQ